VHRELTSRSHQSSIIVLPISMHEFGKFRLDLMSQSRHHTMSRTPVAVAPIVIGGPGSDFTWRSR